MTQVIEKQLSFIVSSETANGALNVSDDGSTFSVQLDTPIAIPHTARNCTLEVNQADVWWVIPNISMELSNNMFYFTSTAGYGTPYQFEIPKGLYSVASLNNLFSKELVNLGFPADTFVLSGDASTQKTVLTFNAANIAIDFKNHDDTPREILGFDAEYVPVAGSTVGQTVFGDNVAAFNTVNSFLLHASLVNQGIPVNSTGASIIAKVPIDVSPGSQIVYAPRQPVRTGADNLIGLTMNRFDVWLTDRRNAAIDTNGEAFSATLVLRWK